MEIADDVEFWSRAFVFSAVFGTLLVAQTFAPRRTPRSARAQWPNAAIFLIDTVLARLLAMSSLVGASVFASAHGVGLFNRLDGTTWFEFVAALVLLDFGVYLQHRLFHRVPMLWRMHAVHHSDVNFDLTTGLRFHPFEIIVSFGIKALLVVLLGASAASVLVFELLLSSASLFTHANVALPRRIERLLRTALVTPDMHRIHHSVSPSEHNTNFGFLIVWWDRWLRTYTAEPHDSHERLRIGLESFREIPQQGVTALLLQPLKTVSGSTSAQL